MRRYIAWVAATSALLLATTAPALATKSATPETSGVISRAETIGGHTISPQPVSVDGETRFLFLVVGWDDPVTHCTGQPPVFNGVEQLVASPSDNTHLLVHNEDVPVMLFDVTDMPGPGAFYQMCAEGTIEPFATGEARQRPNLHFRGDTFMITVKSHGVVTDTNGRHWTLNAFLQERVIADGEIRVKASLSLTPR